MSRLNGRRFTLRRLTLRRMTLRRRLVAIQLALLMLGCGLIAIVTSIAMRHFLMSRLDEQLSAASSRFASSLAALPDAQTDPTALTAVEGQAAGTLGAQVVRGRITAINLVPSVADHDDDDDDHDGDDRDHATIADQVVIAALQVTRTPRTIHLPDLGAYRVSVVSDGSAGGLLVTGLPTDPVDDTVVRLLLVELVVFAIVVVLTGVAGAVSVRLSLRPLNRVARTARRVSALPLSSGEVSLPERVPDPAPGTEVGHVAEAFNQMLTHVESALADRYASEERLRRFVADASHELRTPVAVIRSHAEYAQRAGGDALPEPVEMALERITIESDRMGRLVQDLLLLAQLDSGRPLARDQVDLTRLVLDAVAAARVTGGDHRWQLDLAAEPVSVIGDEHALHQVVTNLLSNARAHTPPGTLVTTSLVIDASAQPAGGAQSADDSGTMATLVVLDDGPGIPAEVLPQVFGRFVRADVARSHDGGTGLGLSIVDAIVRAHHGSITVQSRPGRTRFELRLPAQPSAQEPDEQDEVPGQDEIDELDKQYQPD